ncbi:MAG: hypothetical protein WCG60_00045 [bacterium]
MKKYLPSRKFLIALSVAVVIVLILIIINYSKTNTSIYAINSDNIKAETVSKSKWASNSIDSDNDDLANWQETLYGTDPQNPDTDNDGTADGQEVAESRDPLKANTSLNGQAPNDKMDSEVIANNKLATEEYENLNTTEKIARNMLSDIMATQQGTGSITDEQAKYLAENIIKNLPQKEYSSKTIESDLNFVDTTEENVKNYAIFYYTETAKLELVLNKDADIINKVIEKPSAENIKNLDIIISLYNIIINDFIKAPLPKGSPWGTTYHLMLINELEKLVLIEKDLGVFSKDPADNYFSFFAYSDTKKILLSVMATMDTIFGIERPIAPTKK